MALILIAGMLICCAYSDNKPSKAILSNNDDLISLFNEWRDFERPTFRDGVLDYSDATTGLSQ